MTDPTPEQVASAQEQLRPLREAVGLVEPLTVYHLVEYDDGGYPMTIGIYSTFEKADDAARSDCGYGLKWRQFEVYWVSHNKQRYEVWKIEVDS